MIRSGTVSTVTSSCRAAGVGSAKRLSSSAGESGVIADVPLCVCGFPTRAGPALTSEPMAGGRGVLKLAALLLGVAAEAFFGYLVFEAAVVLALHPVGVVQSQ